MKLNAALIRKVEARFGVAALPEDHSAISDLREAYGDHTFFLDADGLNIVEPNQSSQGSIGNVVKLATWEDEEHTALVSHPPQVLPVDIDLEPSEPEPTD